MPLRYYTYKRRFLVWGNKHLLGIMLIFVFISFITNFCLIFTGFDENTRGTFGDQFGAVNALFSGLAFAGLIYTIILQRRDLKLQRKEMQVQTREFKRENDTLKIQRFENTFFNMLSQFQEIVNNISYSYQDIEKDKTVTVKGRDAFYVSFEEAPHRPGITSWDPLYENQPYRGMDDVIRLLGKEGYMQAYTPSYFDHYFRMLYRILKFVKTSPLVKEFDDEYEYTAMLRAMLSRYELVWIYYNGLSEYGEEKLKPLLERYAMLKNLREDLLSSNNDGFGEYKESAYKKTYPQEKPQLAPRELSFLLGE